VSPELPPQVGLGLLKKGLLAGVLIVLLSAGAVSATGFLQTRELLDRIGEGRAAIDVPEIDRAEAGEAQTLMILGSDQRYADKKSGLKPRSDTILLVRLDPDKEATAVMSIPRDLKATPPGHSTDKINAAYELGGPRLMVRTVKKLLSKPGRPFAINHVINVDFGGFRRAVNYIDGVYVDVDRDYFNDNTDGGENFAAINVDPGYQKLKGQDALDYVRYRHGDNDLVRAARQQDFLRQMRNQAGVKKLLDYRERNQLATIFARYTDSDKGLRRTRDVFSLLKLVLFTGQKPVREVRFRIDDSESLVYVTASKNKLEKTVGEFLNAQASKKPRQTSKPTRADRRGARKTKRNPAAKIPGLEIARREGEDQAIVGERRARFPFYFPTQRYRGSRYAGTEPRIYSIRDELGKLHRAYRLVVSKGIVGEYYGLQGTTWREPPILDDPSEMRRCTTGPRRKLELHYDGRRLRLVAWRTPKAVYWVSNTLTQSLGERQMIGIACSLRRLGQK